MLRDQQINAFDKTITALNKAGVLTGILIVGSWAEYLYKQCNILDYSLTMRTQDVDILIKNKNKPKGEVSRILQDNGFVAIPDCNGLVKFDYQGELEVEFLIKELGRGQTEPYKTALNVPAQGLRHMEMLINYSMEVQYKAWNINIPSPLAYILHKLTINAKRKPYKQEKDAEAVGNIYHAISAEDKKSLKTIFKTDITKKEKTAIIATCNKFPEFLSELKICLLE